MKDLYKQDYERKMQDTYSQMPNPKDDFYRYVSKRPDPSTVEAELQNEEKLWNS